MVNIHPGQLVNMETSAMEHVMFIKFYFKLAYRYSELVLRCLIIA